MRKSVLFAVTPGKVVHMGYCCILGETSQTRQKSAELYQEVSRENFCSHLEFAFQELV